jgi:two-component system sensor histidine kinase/response regulator
LGNLLLLLCTGLPQRIDTGFPCLDGFELTGRIRSREKEEGGHIPIVAMTAHAMKGDKEQCLAAGMDAYVSKPVMLDEFLAVVETLTQSLQII